MGVMASLSGRAIYRSTIGLVFRRCISSGRGHLCASTTPNSSQDDRVPTATEVVIDGTLRRTPREANTDLLNFLNQSDIQKRRSKINLPYFTAGSYLAVTRADPNSHTGTSKFVGICIALRNKGLGTNFILRNVLNGVGVEMMYELYSPAIREIQVLKLERRRRAKLYYLREKPAKFSTVSEKMKPVPNSGVPSVYKRKRGDPA